MAVNIDWSQFSPTQPFLIPVNSTAITTIEYIPFRDTVKVEFANSGETYAYYGISFETLVDWLQAPSIGRFFNQYIRNVYEYTQE